MVDSDGKFYGSHIKPIYQSIKNGTKGSKSIKRKYQHRDTEINRVLKQLPWNKLSVLVLEDLTDIKRGKQKNRSKGFRKAISPWTIGKVVNRIKKLAEENRVRLLFVDPAKTSQTCPVCNRVDRKNRNQEEFRCVSCNYTDHADKVGAMNILAKGSNSLGSLESPRLKKDV
jgi:IS605 OrfB family transposase